MSKKIIVEKPLELTFVKPEDMGIDVSGYPVKEIGPIEQLELPTQEPIVIKGYEDMGTPPDLSIEIPIVEPTLEPIKPTIYDKYERLIKTYQDGSIHLDYPSAMEILRYCESKIGSKISLNMSCQNCMFDLVKMFINLK